MKTLIIQIFVTELANNLLKKIVLLLSVQYAMPVLPSLSQITISHGVVW
jgi:hypothetical protein